MVTLSTQSLTFAAQAVSITSAAQTILLTNTGSGGLTPLTIGTTGDFAQTNNCAVPVSPGIACTIGVTFTPTAGGVRNGTLTLTDNAVNSPQIVLLTGIGQGAMASLSATSLTFAGQAVATASAPQTITLSNPGGLTLTNLTMSMNGDFSQTNTCGGSVPAGANCTISVTFTPTASGARTGTLTLTDTAANSPQTVTLSGTGLGSGVNLSASSLTFTGQTVSTQSGAQTITLTNTGNAALTPLTITRSGHFCGNQYLPRLACGRRQLHHQRHLLAPQRRQSERNNYGDGQRRQQPPDDCTFGHWNGLHVVQHHYEPDRQRGADGELLFDAQSRRRVQPDREPDVYRGPDARHLHTDTQLGG